MWWLGVWQIWIGILYSYDQASVFLIEIVSLVDDLHMCLSVFIFSYPFRWQEG